MDIINDVTDLTLHEAIQKIRNHYSNLIEGADEKEKTWFLNHDATHVIFGTAPFELKGEMLNDIWSIFGSTVTLKKYSEFLNYTTVEKTMKPYGGTLAVFFKSLRYIPDGFVVLYRTRKMTKKWPWHINDALLQRKVGELRKAFNIIVIK